MSSRTVVVLAGGRGTRLATVTGASTPKALVAVAGRSFIDWKLDQLHAAGATDVLVLTGHHGDAVAAHVGDGSQFGLRVGCRRDGAEPVGTGGAVRSALGDLPPRFWVTYGDSLMTVDLAAGEQQLAAAGGTALMTVWRNRDELGPSNALVRGNHVVAYAKDPPPPGAEHIDYGMLLLGSDAFRDAPTAPFDLGAILGDLAERGELVAFGADEPFHDVNDPEALRATEIFLLSRPQPGAGRSGT
jgi:NDP-sugar pyrophosphorylase family protein